MMHKEGVTDRSPHYADRFIRLRIFFSLIMSLMNRRVEKTKKMSNAYKYFCFCLQACSEWLEMDFTQLEKLLCYRKISIIFFNKF